MIYCPFPLCSLVYQEKKKNTFPIANSTNQFPSTSATAPSSSAAFNDPYLYPRNCHKNEHAIRLQLVRSSNIRIATFLPFEMHGSLFGFAQPVVCSCARASGFPQPALVAPQARRRVVHGPQSALRVFGNDFGHGPRVAPQELVTKLQLVAVRFDAR